MSPDLEEKFNALGRRVVEDALAVDCSDDQRALGMFRIVAEVQEARLLLLAKTREATTKRRIEWR